jgi:hypothetical protein
MLERKKASLRATAALAIVKGTLRAVTLSNRARHIDGHMPRAWLQLPALPRLVGSAAPLQLTRDELVQRPLEHRGDVPTRHRADAALCRCSRSSTNLFSGNSSSSALLRRSTRQQQSTAS